MISLVGHPCYRPYALEKKLVQRGGERKQPMTVTGILASHTCGDDPAIGATI